MRDPHLAGAVPESTLALGRRMVEDLRAELARSARAAGDAAEVRLIETHLSWILLGPEVYKIKKPVRFPFVDFATFEERERACRNEVRINRRLAPRAYLGVVPVRRRGERFTFEAGGAIVEWAVRMKRLDEARQADAMIRRGVLDGATIDRLAVEIASFHADSPTGPRIMALGAPAAIEQHVRENFAALAETAATLIEPEALAEIERWQVSFLRGHADRFEARMKAGAIRDGHGDLRLEHVFVLDDDFEIIDGIEFDDRYRWGDVAADVAFLAMDLARLGRADFAERFVAAYARAAEDFDLYSVLDFYESYRACVRAKILAPADPAGARRCLLLAAAPQKRSVVAPMLVCVGGGIASGKSTLADRLAANTSAPVIDADRTRKHMLGLGATSHSARASAWSGAYSPEQSALVYAEVLRRAEVVLASGRPVVVDASFRTSDARAAARALAERSNVPFRFVECRCPLAVAKARVAARDAATSVSDATPDIVDSFAARFEAVTELPPTEHIVVDTSADVASALAPVLAEVGVWPKGFTG